MQWLDERTGAAAWLKSEVLEKRAPCVKGLTGYFNCFGGVALVFFAIQVLSGIYLLAYYIPHPDYAFKSIQLITTQVPLGWLIRRVHIIGAHFLLILVVIHMLKVFFSQAYKPPRELHWISGVMLLFLVLAMNFTGYLLPWSQLSYWATTVATSVPDSIPVVGRLLVQFLRGGTMVCTATLGRFYIMHIALIPIVMSGLMVAHFKMIRHTGIARPL